MKKIFYRFIYLVFFVSALGYADDLYVCTNPDGSTNIVSGAKRPADSLNCKLYEKGMLGKGTLSTSSDPDLEPINKDNNKKEATTKPFTQATVKPENIDYDSITVKGGKNGVEISLENATRVPLNGQQIDVENNKEAKNIDNKSKKDSKNQQISAEENKSALSEAASIKEDIIKIYYCPNNRGGSLVEGTTPPDSTCNEVGVKSESQAADTSKKSKLTGKTARVAEFKKQYSENKSKDIYKCFDEEGKVNFIPEDQTEGYRNCSFFQKSFANAKADLIENSQKTRSLEETAALGVAKKKDDDEQRATAALKCTGAGTGEFNGQKRNFDCSVHSYDFTAGHLGGEISSADRSAHISAYKHDYINSKGSCGGTIVTPDGRTLHILPTKDCPPEVIIAAQRIEEEYIKTISINVNNSAAFRERQRQLAPQVNEIAAKVGVDPFLVHAVISAESAYKSKAVSHAGAGGLMQLMPATARRFGVHDRFHTGENIRGGATYLKWLLNEFNGNYQLAIAAYNAGEGNVRKYGYKIPPFIETRAYVPKVLEYYRRYKANPAQVGLQ